MMDIIIPTMNIKEILEAYREGNISTEKAEKMLRMDYLQTLGDDVLFDCSRQLRKDVPEVVYASSKSPEAVAAIAASRSNEGMLIISRAGAAHYEAVKKVAPDAVYKKSSGLIVIGRNDVTPVGKIGILTAGTSDTPVAEEAAVMAEAMGVGTICFHDVGVAGIHRIIEPMKRLLEEDVDAIIVVAGMEGALPTLVSSLSSIPVIGVPTSTGYGMGGKGEAALMCMLQTCSPGLSVVNIDNGIGAGAVAALIARRRR